MADDATDMSKVEQISIYIQFMYVMDNKLEVCEQFLAFTSVP